LHILQARRQRTVHKMGEREAKGKAASPETHLQALYFQWTLSR
jgi:hypothetical protein